MHEAFRLRREEMAKLLKDNDFDCMNERNDRGLLPIEMIHSKADVENFLM